MRPAALRWPGACIGLEKMRLYERAFAKMIEVIRVPNHHAAALIEPFRMVVSTSAIVLFLMCELEFDPVVIKSGFV